MIRRRLLHVALALAASPAPALAAEPLQITSSVMVQTKTRASDGTVAISLAPADRVVPGDHVVIVLSYRNGGSQPLADVSIANPLPASLAYHAPAQGSLAPEVSADGKAFAPLVDLRLAAADGVRVAVPADVTHLRWRLTRPLAAGAQGQFAFQAVVR